MTQEEFDALSRSEKLRVPVKDLPKRKQKLFTGCLLPIIVGIVAISIIGTCNDKSSSVEIKSVDTSSIQISAVFKSKEIVKTLLKSPSSAEFPMGEQNCWLLPDSTIIVKGSVDSQNSFGAMLRSNYIVKYKWYSDIEKSDNWDVVDYYLE